KDLQAKETNGSDEGRKRSARLRERTQRVEDGLVAHFPFGPRGSTIVPSSIALACLEKMQKLTPPSTTVAPSGKLRPRETVMSWLRSSGRVARDRCIAVAARGRASSVSRFDHSDLSDQPVGFEMSGAARDEDSHDSDARNREKHSGGAE